MLRGLTDRAPWYLTKPHAALWERLYGQAEEIAYSGRWGKHGITLPAHVATKICDDLWTRSGANRVLPKPESRSLPPGDMISLGYAVEVQYYDARTKAIETMSFRLPTCLWSDQLQAVFVFTRLKIPQATMPAAAFPEMLALYRKWHDGKMPKHGVSIVRYPAPAFTSVSPCVAVTYRSDKFDENNEFVDYVHHHDRGASGNLGPMLFAGPDCVMIRGGRLALTSEGLIH